MLLQDMNGIYDKILESAKFLVAQTGIAPDVAMILGTGLGSLAERIDPIYLIPYEEIPHFCVSTVEGHKGKLIFGTFAGKQVVAMQGRFHYYEGYGLDQVTFPVRVLKELSARLLVVNSAAGGLDVSFKPGDVMIVTDHINMIASNPLRGLRDSRLGDRFPDMSRVYDPITIDVASQVIEEIGAPLRRGVYVAVSGPSMETPAETRMLRLLGADAVGMSSVPEIITAVQVGFRVLFLVVITNVNDPDNMAPISLSEVIQNANLAEPLLAEIMEKTLGRIQL
ncbi:MAG: purine-nucleoside phosphorylase [Deltaproteobacteria bacterium]|nr:purine-nucleoside phosphorylase [Deltaproteobacteria bacterium]